MAELYGSGISAVLAADTAVKRGIYGLAKVKSHLHKFAYAVLIKLCKRIVFKDLGIKEAPVRPVQKPEVKPVSGATQPEKPKKEKAVDIPKVEYPKEEKKAEDLSWME